MPSFRPIIASWTKGTIQDHYFKEAKVPPPLGRRHAPTACLLG